MGHLLFKYRSWGEGRELVPVKLDVEREPLPTVMTRTTVGGIYIRKWWLVDCGEMVVGNDPNVGVREYVLAKEKKYG
jgi:hypothetical protein